jgi:hypothetical protein
LTLLCAKSALFARDTQPTPPEAISASQWDEDLNSLLTGLLEKHPNFFMKTSVEDIVDAIEALRVRLDEFDDQQIVMELCRIIAMGGDAHTTVGFGAIGQQMHRMPIRFMVLDDGVYVTQAAQTHAEHIGSRVVSINHVPIGDVIERVSVLFAYENNSKKIGTSAWYATLVSALHAVGVIEDHLADSVSIELQADGETSTHDILCTAAADQGQWTSFVQLLDQPWPIAYRKQGGYYQSDFIAEHNAMYIAYNRCREANDLPMAQFVEFIMSKSEELDAQRIIIDLRFNGGGDETVIWPLWKALEKSERFTGDGDIFGLISRQTFSSAMSNSHQLRDNCGAILIGEPTGGKPNHFGQLNRFPLPHSGLTISHSTRWFQKVEGDPDAVHPDVLIPWRSEPLFGGQDQVLDAALNYEPED